jgi:hypothetical protein
MDQVIEDEGKLGHGFTFADELEKIDLGDGSKPRTTYINAKLKEFKDCFAWEYYEMPGLDRSIVEHRLPSKPGYRPFQQHPRQCNPKIYPDIKAEITKLLEAGFIQQCRYAEWIYKIVSVYKKNDKLRVCIDFRDLNKATSIDGYPMLVADALVNVADKPMFCLNYATIFVYECAFTFKS